MGDSELIQRPHPRPPPCTRWAPGSRSLAHTHTHPRWTVPGCQGLPTRGRCATTAAHRSPRPRGQPCIWLYADQTRRAPRELTLCVPLSVPGTPSRQGAVRGTAQPSLPGTQPSSAQRSAQNTLCPSPAPTRSHFPGSRWHPTAAGIAACAARAAGASPGGGAPEAGGESGHFPRNPPAARSQGLTARRVLPFPAPAS